MGGVDRLLPPVPEAKTTGYCLPTCPSLGACGLRLGSFLLFFVLFAADLAFGQATGQVEGPPDLVPADSTRYPTLFDRIGIHPQLTAKFQVNRGSTTFQELLKVRRHFGRVLVDSDWNVRVQRNEERNNRRQQSGKGDTRLAYAGQSLGGWTVGTAFSTGRSNSSETFSRKVKNDSAVSLTSSWSGLRLVAPDLGVDDSFYWDVTADLSATEETSINERFSRTSTGISDADSTSSDGGVLDFGTALGFVPATDWKFTAEAGWSRGTDDFSTRLEEASGDSSLVSFLDGTNRDRARDLRIASGWRRDQNRFFEIGAYWARSVTQDFSSAEEQQDTRTAVERSFSLDTKGEPYFGIGLDFSANLRRIGSTFDLSDNGSGSDGWDTRLIASYVLGPAWSMLDGVELEFDGGLEERDYTADSVNSPDYTQETISIKGTVRKSWRRNVSLSMSASGELEQSFYEDDKDRDEVENRVEALFTYALGERFSNTDEFVPTLHFNYRRNQTIAIAAARANGNTDQTSITAGGRYTWTFNPRLELSQDITVTANSSTLPFDEDRSKLTRTSQLRSTLNARLGERILMSFDHDFRARDSGAFRIDPEDGIRKYIQDTKGIQQVLNNEIRLAVHASVDLFYNQRYQFDTNKNLVSGAVNRDPRTEITWGGVFRHYFSADSSLNVDLKRLSSTREESDWRGQASVSRIF